MKIKIISLAVLVVLCVGCSTVSKEAKEELAQPVNCETAREDIKALEGEKASVGKQALAGVRSVLPVAVVAGLLSGDYKDRTQVATGKYNRDIDAKIKDIKTTCGIK